ncbi:MAG: tRNA (N(6)-L-threonylcarbamoyladenosine(37)-C(2))-methylthiotransferase MtaB [Bacteroidetes bacterium]|nr:tRNA (N(6)-L-threonylcarbamoyladenosine(37)-C(2))-methylthiotransferase MtaB [Bacteroidota bacterium]
MPSVAFHTLGCKLNFSETSTISRKFKESGYEIAPFDQSADIYVINTCSVTDHADRKTKKVVRDAKKLNPDSKVAIIGCYAQLKPDEIVQIPGVDMVLGAAEKFNLVEHLSALDVDQPCIVNSHIKDVKDFNASYSFGERTRTFLKVQDGCNYFCAFCTIPLARGRSRSDTIENIVKQANEIAAQGIKEIVLTGVNIGDFGQPNDETFIDLVKELDKVEGIERFRISSIEPNLLKDEIIEFVAQSEKFVPHFHIPLQSGSDTILKAMRRRYERKLYRNRIGKIKELMPDCCIGVDVIVGFPGETDELFLETYHFLNELPISYLHVFSYSERPNTTAIRIDDVVPKGKRTERRKQLQILSEKKKRAYYEQFVGETRQVLFEGKERDGFIHGHTDNYLEVKVESNKVDENELCDFHLSSLENDLVMSGEIAVLTHSK